MQLGNQSLGLPKVPVEGQKEFIPIHHRQLDHDLGRRRHIIPCPVCGIGKLQPVEQRLEGGRQTGQQGGMPLASRRDIYDLLF